ncbi:MAG: hypothetical protein KJO08_03945 [Gammaproteobacteria bacterium]|nr:hypothetical protein [Gammaproteobacteria bacterium]
MEKKVTASIFTPCYAAVLGSASISLAHCLIIGEDSGEGHQNDSIWAFDLGNKKLTRILSTPYGSETTSPYVIPDLNGFCYIMAVVQHPYGESDHDKKKANHEAFGYTGYIGPLPACR